MPQSKRILYIKDDISLGKMKIIDILDMTSVGIISIGIGFLVIISLPLTLPAFIIGFILSKFNIKSKVTTE
jgi:hypothetical protein